MKAHARWENAAAAIWSNRTASGLETLRSIEPDMNALMRTRHTGWYSAVFSPVLLAGTLALTGCAVDSHGALYLDADELTAKKVSPFQMAFGNAVLRRTLDGRYQIKLYDRQAIFDVAHTDGVLVDSVLSANNETYVTLRIPRPSCQYVYRTLLVKQHEVDHYDLPVDCGTPVSFTMEDGHLLGIQQKSLNARYWSMTDTTVVSGIVPATVPVLAVREVREVRSGGVSRAHASGVSQHRTTPRHKTDSAISTASSGAAPAGIGISGDDHPLSGATVVGAPQKISTADSANRKPVHIDLDDSH